VLGNCNSVLGVANSIGTFSYKVTVCRCVTIERIRLTDVHISYCLASAVIHRRRSA